MKKCLKFMDPKDCFSEICPALFRWALKFFVEFSV